MKFYVTRWISLVPLLWYCLLWPLRDKECIYWFRACGVRNNLCHVINCRYSIMNLWYAWWSSDCFSHYHRCIWLLRNFWHQDWANNHRNDEKTFNNRPKITRRALNFCRCGGPRWGRASPTWATGIASRPELTQEFHPLLYMLLDC